jgi:hypothetical protein
MEDEKHQTTSPQILQSKETKECVQVIDVHHLRNIHSNLAKDEMQLTISYRLSDFGNLWIHIGDSWFLGEWRVLDKQTNLGKILKQNPDCLDLKVDKGEFNIMIDILKWIHCPRFVAREHYIDVDYINHYIYLAILLEIRDLLEYIKDNTLLILNKIDFGKVNTKDMFIDLVIILHCWLGRIQPSFFQELLLGLIVKSKICIQEVVDRLRRGTSQDAVIVKKNLKINQLPLVTYRYFMMADYSSK